MPTAVSQVIRYLITDLFAVTLQQILLSCSCKGRIRTPARAKLGAILALDAQLKLELSSTNSCSLPEFYHILNIVVLNYLQSDATPNSTFREACCNFFAVIHNNSPTKECS